MVLGTQAFQFIKPNTASGWWKNWNFRRWVEKCQFLSSICLSRAYESFSTGRFRVGNPQTIEGLSVNAMEKTWYSQRPVTNFHRMAIPSGLRPIQERDRQINKYRNKLFKIQCRKFTWAFILKHSLKCSASKIGSLISKIGSHQVNALWLQMEWLSSHNMLHDQSVGSLERSSRHGQETIIDVPNNIHNAKIRNHSNSHKWQDRQTHWHILWV